MIRNYQRTGGAAVDLTPIYNSLNALQNEINSLLTVTDLSTLTSIASGISAFTGSIQSISQTLTMLTLADEILGSSVSNLSTEFTSHTSLFDYRHRTLESSISSAINSLSSSITLNDAKISALAEDSSSLRVSINSLSSSIMDINSIISTLSTAGGGGNKTLTNPTESSTIFTDPVIYSGPNGLDTSIGAPMIYPLHNTYMNGVTWRDAPSTTNEYGRTFGAILKSCLVYGDASYINVYNPQLNDVTASVIMLSQCSTANIEMCAVGTVVGINVASHWFIGGTLNNVQLSNCNILSAVGININHLYSPDCKQISLSSCRIRDISIEYPTSVTRSGTDYDVRLWYNTIDSINAMALEFVVSGNDIWTANLYLDYDLMQKTNSGGSPLHVANNVINELSIFNHDRRSINTTNAAISMNGLNFMTNTISHLRVDLYNPLTLWSNSIDTLEHTLGVFVSARNNSVLEWDCEIAPFSAIRHDLSETKSLAMVYSNTLGKWNVYHGITDESLFTDNLSPIVTAGLNKLVLDISYNSIDYVTFDVLNPLNISFTKGISSALLHVGNSLSVMCPDTVMTLDVVNAELFTFAGGRQATLRIFNAHSIGLTNIFPIFSTGANIDSLNMYMDSTMLTGYSLTSVTINTANIAAFGPLNILAPFVIGSCNITYLDYNQRNGQNFQLINNTIDYCSITGGSVNAWTNTISNLVINARSANLASNEFYGLAGTVSGLSVNTCLLSLGGFYYGQSTGQSNTINRLATGF